MRWKTWMIPAAVVLAVSGGVGYRLYAYYHKQEANKPRGEAVAVETIEVAHRPIREMKLFTGNLTARGEYDAAAKVGGRIVDMPISFGDPVAKDQLLAKIDSEDYLREVEQAEAAMEITAAQLKEAQVTGELRRREYNRQKSLGLATSKAALDSAESAFLAQEATVQMKQAELKKAASSLRTARTRLEDTTVVQKIGDAVSRCFVAETYVDVGDLVQENSKLARIVDIGTLKANLYVIERDYNKIKLGQHADIDTDAYPGKNFHAAVTQISQEVQKNTRQARVGIQITNSDLLLKPGMFVRVKLEFAGKPDAQVVPRSAVLRRDGQKVVFLFDAASGRAAMVPVVTGIAENDTVEIVSPKLDRPVITLGNHLLSDRMPVRASSMKNVQKTGK